MKKLLTLAAATLVLSSSFASFAMAAAQHHNPSSENASVDSAYQYDSSDDNGRNDDQ